MAKSDVKRGLDLTRLRDGNRRELARWLTSVDRRDEQISANDWEELWEGSRRQHTPVMGVSGPPGAGKSTLLHALVTQKKDAQILVLCIDPSSPITGGALLGDRVRLQGPGDTNDERIFIRSMGSHGMFGAISPALDDMILIGKNAGFDFIFVEGVGAGQAEFLLRDYVDLLILLLVPESGDSVQLLKAGSLELADIIVLNKMDRPQSASLWQQIREDFDADRIFQTNASSGDGVTELVRGIDRLLKNPTNAQPSKALVRRLVGLVFPAFESEVINKLSKVGKSLVSQNPFRIRLSEGQVDSLASQFVSQLISCGSSKSSHPSSRTSSRPKTKLTAKKGKVASKSKSVRKR